MACNLDQPLSATLLELALNTDDPARLAAFYADALGYAFRPVSEGMRGIALGRRLMICPGPPKTLAYAAYAVADAGELERLAQRLSAHAVEHAEIEREGFAPGAIAFSDPDGNRFIFGVARGERRPHDNPTAERPARMQHVVFASRNVERLLSFFTEVVGFELSDRVVDENGGLRTAFVRCSREHHSLAVFAADQNRLDHHCYEAGEWNLIRDWADHFAKRRVPLKWGPGRHGPGDNLFLFIHDPDGNWVEISAELEQVGADRPVGEWPHEEYTLNTWGMGLLRS